MGGAGKATKNALYSLPDNTSPLTRVPPGFAKSYPLCYFVAVVQNGGVIIVVKSIISADQEIDSFVYFFQFLSFFISMALAIFL